MVRVTLPGASPPLASALEDPMVRSQLEAELPGQLRQQRWFGARGAATIEARITAALPLPGAREITMVALDVAADGQSVRYQLPLRAESTTDGLVAVDAMADASGADALRAAMLGGDATTGAVPCIRAERFSTQACEGDARPLGVEQSNSSVVFGQGCILKLFRTLPPGRNPDVELTAWLGGPGGFPGVAPVHARLEWDFGDYAADAAVLQDFIPNRGDGWTWALALAREAFDACADPGQMPAELSRQGAALDGAASLGNITARLHAALAAATEPGMAPREATPDDWIAWQHETRAEAARTAEQLESHDATLAAQVADYARSGPEEPPAGSLGLLTRIHGDYHLGQLLDTDRGWVILDFEGEPARPLAERITLNHPLIDVAGMLRSWDYAAHTVGRDNPAREAWLGAVSQAFLDAYWREAGAASSRFLPGPAARDALLRHFVLRKALYELRYELGSRPDWLSIPAAAVRSMLE